MEETAVSYALGKLSDSLLNKYHELMDWRGQFEQMHQKLCLIQALLRDSVFKHHRNEFVTEWLNQVREIANRIASVIDTFWVVIEGNWIRKEALAVKRNYKTYMLGLHDELEDIIHILNLLYQHRTDLEIKDLGALDDVDDPDVVGLEDDKRKILKQLLDINISRRMVLSIVGTGGLGKTTLAQKVYESPELKGHFDCHTWLSISRKFNLNDLLRKILYSIEPKTKAKDPPVTDEDLQMELKSSLSGKRYLIILDDVWTIALWEQLKIALPNTDNSSRVIITSRFIDVAYAADCNTEPYRLCYLNDDEGLALLCRIAFPHIKPENYPRDLLEVAKRLTKKCGGLPLALVVLGGILTRIERKYTDWCKLEETMDWHSGDGMKCSQVLAMSYEDLPYDLKPCFLYFSAFPEDYVISGKHVTKMWIAEGFIQEDGDRTMEDRAEAYLEELVQRCLIQVTKKTWNGCCKYGIMHILLRDLAIHEAKNSNFFTVFPKAEECVNQLAPTKPRRTALQFSTLSDNDIYLENTRSLLCFGSDIGFRKISSNDRGFALLNYSGFRLLRVLTIEFVDMRNFSGLVGLIHLKYMGFRYCTIRQEIFENISFYNIETIDLKGSCIEGETTDWSNVVIPILRHVYGYKKLERIFPLKWDHLTNLQTLKSVGQGQVPSLECCINLRTLGISYLNDHEMICSPLKEWQTLKGVLKRTEQLVSLSIEATLDGGYLVPFGGTKDLPCHEEMQNLRLHGKLGRLQEDPTVPSVLTAEMFPTNLTKLTLEESRLQEDPMPIIEMLQSLRILRLWRYSYEGAELICSTGGFPNLEKLELKELPKLCHWDIKEGAMPILSHLKIDHCDEQHTLPELQKVRTLQELLVNHPSDMLQQRMQREDRYKIKHIPLVLITTDLGSRPVVSEERRHLTSRWTGLSDSVDDSEVVGLEDDSDDSRKQVEELRQLTEQQDPGTQSVGYFTEYRYSDLQDATNNQIDDRTTYTAENEKKQKHPHNANEERPAHQFQLNKEREMPSLQRELSKALKLIELLLSERDGARKHSDLSQKVTKQLMSERDDARKEFEAARKATEPLIDEIDAAQKVTEQLMYERDEARKEVELVRRLTKQQNFTIYRYSELRVATNNFNEYFKLGEGLFSVVYKGILDNITIAIKMLKEESRLGTEEFNQEIEILSKVRHPNLVTLIGACAETRAVIYKYLPNGSLEDRLKCKNNTSPLSWQARTHIAFEICSALSFLHSNKPHGIVHGDLKPSNVLLDLNNVSKLSDFGPANSSLAGFYVTDNLRGTFGYIDPEYWITGKMTPQNDVYSFGIMLLELVTCKDLSRLRQSVEEAHRQGTLKALVDASAGPWPFKEAEKMISLGLRCSDIMRKNRPDLSTIVLKEMKSMADVTFASR